jgi:hypothetical protein
MAYLPAAPEALATPQPAPTKPRRVWPAILTLFFLAPITAEVLSGSTPPIAFLTDPIRLIFNPLLYGCGALLIREVARRRALGWASILWMGAAYGVFEEGVVINTWANPWLPQICAIAKNGVENGICDYSRVGGINLLWALGLTIFHAVVSITIPILLVELAFPSRAARPWFGRKAIVACVTAGLLCLSLGILLNFAVFRDHGQDAPLPAPYLVEIALMALFITLAVRARPRVRPALHAPATRKPPRLWLLRALALLALAEAILSGYAFKNANTPFQVAVAINFALLALATWRVSAWSHRTGWSERHVLALASGALGFFLLLWDPLLELIGQAGGLPTRGIALVALVYLILLIVLSRRTARRLRAAASEGRGPPDPIPFVAAQHGTAIGPPAPPLYMS